MPRRANYYWTRATFAGLTKMPNVLLPAPHFRQSRDGYCLPACVRMVLAFWGDLRDEETLTRQLGTKRHGTPMGKHYFPARCNHPTPPTATKSSAASPR